MRGTTIREKEIWFGLLEKKYSIFVTLDVKNWVSKLS